MTEAESALPPREAADLRGLVLVDARSAEMVDLGAWPPFGLLTLIRHRY